MSPLRAHERYAQRLFDMADAAADALDLPLEPLGSTTLRQIKQRRGVEPDHAFYIANAHRVEDQITLDLDLDPPPDIVIEVDLSSDSKTKLPIYASLGVPEIWLWDNKRIQLLELSGDYYSGARQSKFLPVLTVEILEKQLEKSRTTGRTALKRSFRAWLTREKSS